MDQQTREQIERIVTSDKVVLFMKGTRMQPQCGFSAQVVHILKQMNVDFESLNVFDEDKETLKEYSGWPTFPQLWVDGKLIGGCDIVTEMSVNGELEKALCR